MNRCIVLPNVAFQCKGHFQIGNELTYDTAIEVEEIPRPGTIWYDPVEPARVVVFLAFGRALLVVDKLVWRRLVDRWPTAQHQQSCQR